MVMMMTTKIMMKMKILPLLSLVIMLVSAACAASPILDPWSCLYMWLQYVNHRFSGIFFLIIYSIAMNNNELPNSMFTHDKRYVDCHLLCFVNWYSYYQLTARSTSQLNHRMQGNAICGLCSWIQQNKSSSYGSELAKVVGHSAHVEISSF